MSSSCPPTDLPPAGPPILTAGEACRVESDAGRHPPISEGQKSAMLCHLENIALRTGSVLEVDPNTGRILKNAAAMNLWKREYRAGWEPTGLVRS